MMKKIFFGLVMLMALCITGCAKPSVTPSVTPDNTVFLPENAIGWWQDVSSNKYVSFLKNGDATVFTHGEWNGEVIITGDVVNVSVTDGIYGFNAFSNENGDMEYSINLRMGNSDNSGKIYIKTTEYTAETEYVFAGNTYDDALDFYNSISNDQDNDDPGDDSNTNDDNDNNDNNDDNDTVTVPDCIYGWWQGSGDSFIGFEFNGSEAVYTEGIWNSDFIRSGKVTGVSKDSDTIYRLEVSINGGFSIDGKYAVYVDITNVSQKAMDVKTTDSLAFSEYIYSGETMDEAYDFYNDSVVTSADFPGILLGWWNSADGAFINFTNTDDIFFFQEGIWDSEFYSGNGEIIFIKNTEAGVIITVHYNATAGDDITGPTDEITIAYEIVMSDIEALGKITVKDPEGNEKEYSYAGNSFDTAYSEYIKTSYGMEEGTANTIMEKINGYWCADPDSYLCFESIDGKNLMYQEQWGNTPIDDIKGHITGGAEIESDIWLLIAEYYADTDDEPYMIQFITVDISKISSGDLAISVDNSDMLEFFYAGEDYNTAFDRIHGE